MYSNISVERLDIPTEYLCTYLPIRKQASDKRALEHDIECRKPAVFHLLSFPSFLLFLLSLSGSQESSIVCPPRWRQLEGLIHRQVNVAYTAIRVP